VTVTADLIVSNPPYVAESDAGVLPLEVAANEPHVALFGGADGLDVYRRLFSDGPAVLAADGRLIVEVGYDQAGAVQLLASASGWTFERGRADLQGILRTLIFRRS
jgi:release factor glutamine methyltransferase